MTDDQILALFERAIRKYDFSEDPTGEKYILEFARILLAAHMPSEISPADLTIVRVIEQLH